MLAIVKMDKHGRILIPASIRRKIAKTEFFIVEVLGDEIRLKPLKPLDLTSLFDAVEVDVDDFADSHRLRRTLAKNVKG